MKTTTIITKNENITKYTNLVESQFNIVFDKFVEVKGNVDSFILCTAQVKDSENLPFLFRSVNIELRIHKDFARARYTWTHFDGGENGKHVMDIKETVDGLEFVI